MKVGPWRTKANERQLYLHEIRVYLVEIGYKLLNRVGGK